MDQPLSGDRLTEERAFMKRFSEGLTSHDVQYPSDYSTPLEDRPRKVQAVQAAVSEPPEMMDLDEPAVQDASIEITVKSLKPSLTFPVKAQSTDTVAHLKSLVAASSSSAPAVEQQRLLLKGKALTDTKLLKEYDIGAGAVVHLVIKPAAASATTSTAAPETAGPSSSSSPAAMEAAADGVIGTIPSHATSSAPKQLSPSRISSSDRTSFRQGGPGHVRLPSLTITTSMDDDSSSPGTEMPLSVIDNAPPLGPQPVISSAEFHRTVSDPAFWQKLHALCVSEFTYEDDADSAWENFLIGMKGRLSAGEAARIRDVVGVRGMGGVA